MIFKARCCHPTGLRRSTTSRSGQGTCTSRSRRYLREKVSVFIIVNYTGEIQWFTFISHKNLLLPYAFIFSGFLLTVAQSDRSIAYGRHEFLRLCRWNIGLVFQVF
ncbi:hypothetical protein HanIR_Chr02g0068011 [Helianthus annuus]|nr:hypothetical protein HanIR_Chr02g0068011 [Helianthus annuus]